MELACRPAVVDKAAVACTHIGLVAVELVVAHGYTPMNFHSHEHQDTWEKMIVAAVVDVATIHYRALVQSHVR